MEWFLRPFMTSLLTVSLGTQVVASFPQVILLWLHSQFSSLYKGTLLPLFLLLTMLFPQRPGKPTPSLSLGLCSKATLSERSSNILFSAPMCLLFVFFYYNKNSIQLETVSFVHYYIAKIWTNTCQVSPSMYIC